MSEHGVDRDQVKHFIPDSDLTEYLRKRLHVTRQMSELDAAGKEVPAELDARDKSLRTRKVRILDNIIFQAMANLTFFFEAIASHPELQETLDFDIKDLLGVRYTGSRDYGFMFVKLLRSILIVKDVQLKQTPIGMRDDFRLNLNNIMHGIVLDKVMPFLPNALNSTAEHAVLNDLSRAWGWTQMLATSKEYGDPHRTFDFNSSKLLE
jgi:hypothetical protein